MVCPYCQSKTEIINTRHLSRTNTTWRRRRCLKCRALITTNEEPDYSKLWVILDDQGNLKPFSRDKLYLSLHDSLRHRQRAVSDANGLTATIIAKLAKNSSNGQINRLKLIDTTLTCLKHFDKAASVYYQAYYAKSKPSDQPQ